MTKTKAKTTKSESTMTKSEASAITGMILVAIMAIIFVYGCFEPFIGFLLMWIVIGIVVLYCLVEAIKNRDEFWF